MKLVTSEIASQVLGCSRPTITKMIEDGRLQPFGVVNDRIFVFDLDALERVKPHIVIAESGLRRKRGQERPELAQAG